MAAGLQHGVVLATVKVWPINGGASIKVSATANLDGVCAPPEDCQAAMNNLAMRGIASLDA